LLGLLLYAGCLLLLLLLVLLLPSLLGLRDM
jgi:hypothetical protein